MSALESAARHGYARLGTVARSSYRTPPPALEDDELPGVGLRDLGDHYLKDISRPQRLFQIDADGLPSEFPPLGARTAAGTIATLLAIDLAGWHRVMREIGDDGAAAAAAAYHRIVAETAHANDGLEVERVADWSMCVFSSPKSALLAATAIRQELRTSDWIQVIEKPELTAAVHTGRVAGLARGQLGSSAVRVVLLCDSAEPGQVLVSHSTQALLEGEILEELELGDLGERELPGITPTRVFELSTAPRLPDRRATFPNTCRRDDLYDGEV